MPVIDIEHVSTASTEVSDEGSRIRMVVEPNSFLEGDADGLPSRWVKAGIFVEDQEQRDFGLASIRGTIVPDQQGSDIPLDDDSRHSEPTHNDNLPKCMHHRDVLETVEDDLGCRGSPDKKDAFPSDPFYPEENDLERYAPRGINSDCAPVSGCKHRNLLLFVGGFCAAALIGTFVYLTGDSLDFPYRRIHGTPAKAMSALSQATSALSQVNPIESILSSLANLSDPIKPESDSLVFWLIPNTNAMAVSDIMKRCLHWKLSTVFEDGETNSIVTHTIYHAAPTILSPHQGRMFSVLRDPIERTVDMYLSFKKKKPDVSLKDYLLDHYDNNWLTRYLTNEYAKPLTKEHLATAKHVLTEKCVIGLSSDLDKSFKRFAHYFGWDVSDNNTQHCTSAILSSDGKYQNTVEVPDENSEEYKLLTTRNHMDIPLYEHAKSLYADQKESLFNDFDDIKR